MNKQCKSKNKQSRPRGNQEIFNYVVTFLRKQGRKSKGDNGDCVYLSDTGDKCAAGCLIPPEDYDPRIESHTIYGGQYTSPLFEKLFNEAELRLIKELQIIHDEFQPRSWEFRWRKLAIDSNLIYSPPKV